MPRVVLGGRRSPQKRRESNVIPKVASTIPQEAGTYPPVAGGGGRQMNRAMGAVFGAPLTVSMDTPNPLRSDCS